MEMIRRVYGNSKNFMTPSVLDVGKAGMNRAWELSVGEGIIYDKIYGVTVVDWNPDAKMAVRRDDLSAMFHTEEAARVYISLLGGKE